MLAALVAVPLPVSAEALGRITAFIGGEERIWQTVTMEQGGRTLGTASFDQGPRLTTLRIQGHPEPRFTTRDVFSVEVRYVGDYADGAVPLSVDVIHVPEGMGGPFWTSREATQPARVDVIEFGIWGTYGRLVAAFEAELCFRPMLSAPTDRSRCVPVTGVIETDLLGE